MADLDVDQVRDHRLRVLAELRHEHTQLEVALRSVANREIVAGRQNVNPVRKLALHKKKTEK